eukprot:6182930-Pleurochrysis_carterae.AAC.2
MISNQSSESLQIVVQKGREMSVKKRRVRGMNEDRAKGNTGNGVNKWHRKRGRASGRTTGTSIQRGRLVVYILVCKQVGSIRPSSSRGHGGATRFARTAFHALCAAPWSAHRAKASGRARRPGPVVALSRFSVVPSSESRAVLGTS